LTHGVAPVRGKCDLPDKEFRWSCYLRPICTDRTTGWSFPPASLRRRKDRTISSSSGLAEEGRRMVSEDSRLLSRSRAFPAGFPHPRIVTAHDSGEYLGIHRVFQHIAGCAPHR